MLLVWFESKRVNDGVRFIPHIVDEDCGVGTQITVADINGDGKLDIFNASKRGIQAFLQTDSNDKNSVEKNREQVAAYMAKPASSFVKINDELGGYRPADDEKSPLNFDFEEPTLKDWTATGASFFKQPVFGDLVHARRPDSTSDQNGNGWIGGFEVVGDIATGTLTSRSFKVTHPWASYLIAGGNKPETAVEIVDADSNEVISRTSGVESETLKRAIIDLSKHLNKTIFLRLVDKQTTGWGHVNFDDFRFHAERPSIAPEKTISQIDMILHDKLPPDQAALAMQLPPTSLRKSSRQNLMCNNRSPCRSTIAVVFGSRKHTNTRDARTVILAKTESLSSRTPMGMGRSTSERCSMKASTSSVVWRLASVEYG